ncbi:MAG: hypothetical protein WDZ72_03550 [Cyclobacteriaceae bacterium]
MSNYFKSVVLFLVVFLCLISVYWHWGGFRSAEISLSTCNDFVLFGVNYIGTPQDERLGKAFSKVEASRKDLPLSTIYYKEPSGKRDTLHVFIGFEKVYASSDSLSWDRVEISCKRALKAEMRMHRFVMPGPENTKEKIKAFAKEQGVELKGIFIDKIKGPDWVEVWAPLQ